MSFVSPDGINLSVKQSEAWDYLTSPQYAGVAEVFLGGGAGSGKSAFGCLWQIDQRIRYAGTRGLIGRENFPALRDSTLATFFFVAKEMGLLMGEHYTYNAQDHTIKWANGSETHFRYLQFMPSDPDFTRLGSTEYTDGFIDEAPEINPRAAQVLRSRMRHMHTEYDLTPKLLLTGNPGRHWIRDAFVMDDAGNAVSLPPYRACVLATIRDNPNKQFADLYERSLSTLDRYDRLRLLEGDWNVSPDVKRPFAFAFDQSRHVRPVVYRPGEIVRVSLDFNVEPFCATLWHIGRDYAHCFAEISIKAGTIDEMQQRIRGIIGTTSLIEITGDHNGTNRGIGVNSTASLYDSIRTQLRLSPRQLVLKPNPSHLTSREDVNFVLANMPNFAIDPSCRGTIADLRNVEVDESGKIVKADRSKVNQMSDLLDTVRYAVNTYLWDWIKQKRNELSKRGALRPAEPVPGRGRTVAHRLP